MTQSSEAPKPKAEAKINKDAHASSTELDELDDDGWGDDEQGGKDLPPPRPPAKPARRRKRHSMIRRFFVIGVLAPILLATLYLYVIAKDQYASYLGFSVRAEDSASPVEMLGGITELAGSSSGADTDVLFEFIQSQRIVRLVDEKLDLRKMYHMPSDPVFGIDPDVTIEGLQKFWGRVVKVFYDSGSGLIEVRVTAFDPDDAKAVADAIYDESTVMINKLTAVARDDATSYARSELEKAVERLSNARAAIQKFRLETQIIDPEADIVGRMGLLNSLQNQLASAQIDLDILMQTAREGDPRLIQARRRVDVIEQRLANERDRFSATDGTVNGAYANLIGDYERLSVDKQFAEQAYLSALAGVDAATAEASRKSRYLAAYIEPTLAEKPQYPRRLIILATLAGFLIGIWIVATMIYYSIRDRR
ncbi:sugar transporter [Aliiroseovarius sp. S253]|uniref:sugar transporter n=1 Tax=Aliiroseovarius sp. S253 TaxID=3415133 RepID=UPI003C7BE4D9